ncbi:MAG TPA: hypothetical protein VKQ30_07685 [Ktedonobacterales bacterium]|nr:hypothetical protein [Ktedonobacterales bacterium]
MKNAGATEHAYALAACGHCGVGVLVREAPACPLQPHPLCSDCLAAVQQLISDLKAQGHDPFAPRRRRRKRY